VEPVPLVSRPRRDGRQRIWTGFLLPGGVLLALFFIVPLVLVVVFSFGSDDILGRPVLGFGTQNYAQILLAQNLGPLGRTLAFTAIATVVCILLAYPVGYLLGLYARRAAPVVVGLVVLSWLVDYLVRIYAWQSILAPQGLLHDVLHAVGLPSPSLLHTNFAVIAGLVYGYLPLMILPIYAAVGQLDARVIEAGKDLYGSPAVTFLRVTLPLTRDGLVGGVLLVALPMLGDFATAQFLGGPDSTMVGNLINDQFTGAGSQTVGSAYAVALNVMLLLALLVITAITRRKVRLASAVGPSTIGAVAR
jgi:spermidine/putrescine transport system permease protein